MVDLTLFHPENPRKGANFSAKDRFNGWTRRYPCRFLEWSGWYNMGVAQRLLGHYRLLQLYKASYSSWPRELSAVQSYILQYRATHGVKYFISRVMSYVYGIFTRKDYYGGAEIAAINRMLVNESSAILYDFLTEAETDFAAALLRTINRINHPEFLNKPGPAANYFTQFNQHQYTYHSNTSYNTQVNIQPATSDNIHGKETGVFSKKQVLMFFDLLSECEGFDTIDYERPTRFPLYADILHSLTGKGKNTLLEELHKYRTRGLYEWHTQGELNSLINTLSSLETCFRGAGFKSFTRIISKKIRELEAKKKE